MRRWDPISDPEFVEKVPIVQVVALWVSAHDRLDAGFVHRIYEFE